MFLEIQETFQTSNQTIDHSIDSKTNVYSCNICYNLNHHCLCLKCLHCSCSIDIPYIECSECENVNICCRCFANGVEKYSHKSYHRYRVITNNIVLFEKSDWTAEEELIMLDILFTYGYGNWELISNKLHNRSAQEIKEHYDRFYLNEPDPQLPVIVETDQSLFPKSVIPYSFK